MTIERYLRLIAGFFVMLSVALGYWVNPAWFLFTAFVGLNLFQSAFTNWCPMMGIPMMSISHSDLMPIRSERSDAGLSQCETVIGIRQEFCLLSWS
jgi:hypothetical protein